MSVLSIYELGYDIAQKRNGPPEKTGEIMSLHVSKLQNDTDLNLKLIILFNYGLFSVDLPLDIQNDKQTTISTKELGKFVLCDQLEQKLEYVDNSRKVASWKILFKTSIK